jgi:pSer/pThr/pTyr-binding forkhead associated (FHA) protein
MKKTVVPSSMVIKQAGRKPIQVHFSFIDSLELLLGRDENKCDILLANLQVSRCQMKIKWDRKRLTVEDCSSTNGTKINGEEINPAPVILQKNGGSPIYCKRQPVKPRALKVGDVITVGAIPNSDLSITFLSDPS